VLEVCPADTTPQFEILNEAAIHRPTVYQASVLCGNRIAFLYDSEPIIEVWDFVEDTWACSKLERTVGLVCQSALFLLVDPHLPTQGRYGDRELILSPSLIVLIVLTDVTIWSIPALEPGGHIERPSEAHPPLQSFHLSRTSLVRLEHLPRYVKVFTQPLDWYSDNGQPIWFDCNATVPCRGKDSTQVAIQRCHIQAPSSDALE